MRRRTKSIVGIVAVIIVFAAMALLATWLGLNWENITSGTKLYTESELIDYGEDRYQAGIEKGEEYRVLVDKYKIQVQELEENFTQVTILLEKEKSKNNKNEELIKTLETTITSLNEGIEGFKGNIQDLETKVAEMLIENGQLKDEYEKEQGENVDLKNTIENLNKEIITLKNNITRLQAELEAYKDMELTNVYKVEFKNDALVEDVVYVDEGKALPYIPTIKNTQDVWHYGWALEENKTECIDWENFIPTADTTLFAVKSECVNVKITNQADSDTSKYYRYGKNLKVKDVLKFHSDINFDNENIILTLFAGGNSYKVEQPTWESLLTELPYYKISSGYQGVDGQSQYVYGYILSYSLKYKYSSSTHVYDNETLMISDEVNTENLLYVGNFMNFKGYVEIGEQTTELPLSKKVSYTTSGEKLYLYETEIEGVTITFATNYVRNKFYWGVSANCQMNFRFTTELYLSSLYGDCLRTAEEIDMLLYLEPEKV